jgi:hypothetical protein
MRHTGQAMPAIPASTKSSVTLRLLAHAEQNWPQLKRVEVTYRGAFGYVAGVFADGEKIPLCRLRYGGSAHSFGFAIYSAASDRYQEAALLSGSLPAPPKTPSTPPALSTSRARTRTKPTGPGLTPDELTAPTT